MTPAKTSPIPFPPINRHGVIGDRRTGGLVAPDGTLDWFCVPNFDGTPIFGALLDPDRGGYCRFGPLRAIFGQQYYAPETAAVITSWSGSLLNGSHLELTDLMAWPGRRSRESHPHARLILRRLRSDGMAIGRFEALPRPDFEEAPEAIRMNSESAIFRFGSDELAVWTSFPFRVESYGLAADLPLALGDEQWVVIAWNLSLQGWSLRRTEKIFKETLQYWRNWSADLKVQRDQPRAANITRAAITVQLLTHADHGSAAAALTTSLPERLGGDRNYDYRFAWVRDASLSMALLARLGKVEEVQGYLDWLCGLDSKTDAPLQVCYRLNGKTGLDQVDHYGIRGYADSQPVRYGNRAAEQRQVGSLAFLADCASIYLENGGILKEEYWHLLLRAARYTCAHWHLPGNGIWELTTEGHYVADKVMSWVVLERTIQIAQLIDGAGDDEIALWTATANTIHDEVMDRGWSQTKNSFVQRYDTETIDAAALLIPLMDFLVATDPRAAGTLSAIEQQLVIDGLVHRFDPQTTFGSNDWTIEEFEGAFLPATFWFAHVLAKSGRAEEAEKVLARCEAISGSLGLFAEEAERRQNRFLGNFPLLFAHVEYVRAAVEVNKTRAHRRGTEERNRSVE